MADAASDEAESTVSMVKQSQNDDDDDDADNTPTFIGLSSGEIVMLEVDSTAAHQEVKTTEDEADTDVNVNPLGAEAGGHSKKRSRYSSNSTANAERKVKKMKMNVMQPSGDIVTQIVEVELLEMHESETPATITEIEEVARNFSAMEKQGVTVEKLMFEENPETGELKCKDCSKIFPNKQSAVQHVGVHCGKPYMCPQSQCSKSFRSKEASQRHCASHSGEKPYTCEECNRKFMTNHSLREHMAIHLDTKLYKCNVCSREFRQMSSLSRHQTVHSANKIYSCDVCGKGFTRATYLRSHWKSHTGEKPFRCDVCAKSYAHRSDLNRHKIIHTGRKPYSCDWCGQSFADSSSRRRHMRDHNETRQYTCHLCHMNFRKFALLKMHLNRRHNIIEVRDGGDDTLKIVTNTVIDDTDTEPRTAQIQTQLLEVLAQLRNAGPDSRYQFVAPPGVTDVNELVQASRRMRDSQSGVTREEQDLAVQLAMSALQAEQNVVGENLVVVDQELPVNADGTIGEHVYLSDVKHNRIQLINERGEVSYVTIVQNTSDGRAEHDTPIAVNQTDGTGESKSAVDKVVVEEAGSAEVHSVDSQSKTVIDDASKGGGVNETEEGVVYRTLVVGEEEELSSRVLKIDNDNCVTEVELNMDLVKMHYDQQPDLDHCEYRQWLSTFVELCKCWSMPLEVELYEKITHVHKTLSDALAKPKGKLSKKENFVFLSDQCKILSSLITQHLASVLTNLK